MTVRQHLAEIHGRAAKHFASKVSFHQKRAIELRKLGHDVLADLDDQQAIESAAMHKLYSEASEKCAKADCGDDLNKLAPLPDGLSIVTPTAPASSLRAVPRAGQKEIGDMPKVDMRFEHLVKIDD